MNTTRTIINSIPIDITIHNGYDVASIMRYESDCNTYYQFYDDFDETEYETIIEMLNENNFPSESILNILKENLKKINDEGIYFMTDGGIYLTTSERYATYKYYKREFPKCEIVLWKSKKD